MSKPVAGDAIMSRSPVDIRGISIPFEVLVRSRMALACGGSPAGWMDTCARLIPGKTTNNKAMEKLVNAGKSNFMVQRIK